MTKDVKLSQISGTDANEFFAEVKQTFSEMLEAGYLPTIQYAPVVVCNEVVYTAFITAPKEDAS